ncbi:fibronectin type III domain-containing protein [Flavobacterium sp. N3904]|uniref:fibronectin type III domain-containing protein n=1 Tax=Flavobacterium sp. N3904 TaxID=2986835 RepID=UPI0022256F39|nr:T9SS sorting signal type C domain-containing protein [Flavobacterium sp. N3904]
MKLKLLSVLLILLLCQSASFAQCTFANQPFIATPTVQSICYNTEVISPNVGEVATAGVTVGTYVAVNVIKGYTYAIKTTNTDLGFIKRVTLFESTATGTSLATAISSTNTTAISLGWTATFTGVLYVQFNNDSNACAASTSADTITIAYTGGNDTGDSQLAYGVNSWIGHVYNFSNTVGVPPNDANAFSNYLGYFNQTNTVTGTTTSFSQNYGGSDTCFPYVADGAPATFRTDTYAVKYRMRSTLNGCYLVKIDGDDGVRLTVDGVKVFDAWIQQGTATYDNVLVYLDASKNGGTGTDLLFEYYEKNGGNVSNFTMTPFVAGSNSVTAPSPFAVCSGASPGVIDGSAFVYNGATVNPTIKFQWQSSPDNSTWNNISGATSEDYTPPAITTTTVNVTVYYRRVVSAVAAAASSCVYTSNSIAITTSPVGTIPVPFANAATGVTCSQINANWSPSANASSYLIDVATDTGFASILPLYNNLNVGDVTTYTITNLPPSSTYYYRVRAMNGCSTTASSGTISATTLAFVPTTQVGSNYQICIDSPTLNTRTTASINSGQYVLLDVVQGFGYTFSVGDVFSGLNESLNILDASTNNNVSPTAFSTAAAGTSLNWTATFSGQIKIVLSSSDCSNTGATGGALQLKLNTVGDTLDSQTIFGDNAWIGYVYNWTVGPPPGGASPNTLTTSLPFVTANYAGYYNEPETILSQGFGGDTGCFPVLTAEVNRTNVYADKFAVRYRMKSTKVGCYLANMNGDDGFRLYVDGTLVFNSWGDKGNTTFGNVLIYLTGSSELVFDYYENAGGNVVGFSMTPFVASSNTITAPTPALVCSGTTPNTIIGTLTYNGATVNPTINFQWQSSPDNTNWTDIPSATLQNYTPVAVTTTTSNVTVYYRRIVVGSSAATSGCTYTSNVISITTSPGIAAAPSSPFGSGAACTQITANWSASVDATSYRLDVSAVNTFASFVAGYNNLNVANVTAYPITGLTAGVTYYIRVRAVNGCGTSSNSVTATFSTLSATPATPGTVSGTAAQCPSLTGQVYSIVAVANATTYSWTVPTGWTITAGAGTTSITVSTGTTGGNISVTAGNSCGTSAVKTLAVTVGTTTSVGGTLNGSTTVCAGTNSTLLSLAGFTGTIQRWESSTDNFVSVVNSIGNLTATYTATNLSTTTQYRVVVKNGTSCAVNSSTAAIAITPSLTAVGVTPNIPQSFCSNSAGTLLAATITGGGVTTNQWGKRSVSGGAITAITGQTGPTYTPTGAGLTAGTWFVVCTSTPTCGSPIISNEVLVVVNALPTAPTISSKTDISCTVSTGSVTLGGLPSGTWTINPGPGAISDTGTSYTVTGLAVNSYTFTVADGNGCPSAPSAFVSILDSSSTTWNGTTWTNGTPNSSKSAIIASVTPNQPFTADIAACALTVDAGIIVTVPSGVTLTITNAVTTNGQLIFQNDASLVQDAATTTNSNSGAIEYQRSSAPMKNFDYTYWSSPVTGQSALGLSPNTFPDKYFKYNGTANAWVFYNGIMTPGVGYIIRTPKGGIWPNGENVVFPYSQPVAFKGVPNNGDYSYAVGPNEFNLVGNPYPSAIDADEFMNVNSDLYASGLYFWTHITPIATSGPSYQSSDYATYNGSGGTAASTGGAPPSGQIAAGQSFFVGSANITGSSFKFTNSMRVAGNNSQFFKMSKTKKSAAIEKNRVWLNLTNSGGAFKQLLVGYIAGATDDVDKLYDAANFNGNTYVNFYSLNNGKNYTIQGRAVPFKATDEVPLGYKSTIEGPFEIGIANRDGLLANQEIWLEDKKTAVMHDLTKGSYSFTAIKGTENDRFVLKYTNKTLGTDDHEIVEKALNVYVKNKKITIVSTAEALGDVFVYDLRGRLLYENKNTDKNEFVIPNLNSGDQFLIVVVQLANGKWVSKEIVF